MDFELHQVLLSCDVFMRYVKQYPTLAETVLHNILTVEQTFSSQRDVELLAGRDAAGSLSMIAREGELYEAANFFYQVYEDFCFRLLAMTQGGLS